MPRRLKKILITAGPTQEPIDAVRYIGNRSSGRLGMALATEAAERGDEVVLLLGPVEHAETDTRVRVERFRTAAELGLLLRRYAPACDVLIMAAAVADFRVKGGGKRGKLKRAAGGVTLNLEPTEDLLAGVAERRGPGQTLVGFALEPAAGLLAAARKKLVNKGVDLIVANALRTMDAPDIEATVLDAAGVRARTPGLMSKPAFAAWLLEIIDGVRAAANPSTTVQDAGQTATNRRRGGRGA
ncbi:hypothetical protein BH11PLA1_BH11PLA1_11450 [soil metagenome]